MGRGGTRQPAQDLIIELLVRASRLEQRQAAAAAVMGRHGAPQPTQRLMMAGEHVDIEVVQELDGWPAR
jgi:hypothetical protein